MRINNTRKKKDGKKRDTSFIENLIFKSMEKAFEEALKTTMDDLFEGFKHR